jgi:hypothetical protein
LDAESKQNNLQGQSNADSTHAQKAMLPVKYTTPQVRFFTPKTGTDPLNG